MSEIQEYCYFEVGYLCVHMQRFFGWFTIHLEWSVSSDPPDLNIYLPMHFYLLTSGLPWFSYHWGKWKD